MKKRKLEAKLQAFCVSVASYNLLIGEAYYFLAASPANTFNAKYKLSKFQFLKPAQFMRIACTLLPLDEKNIHFIL